MDEICTEVWDYLYKNGPTSVNAIARALERSDEAIHSVASNAWFASKNGLLAIAVSEPKRDELTRFKDETSIQTLRRLFHSRDSH